MQLSVSSGTLLNAAQLVPRFSSVSVYLGLCSPFLSRVFCIAPQNGLSAAKLILNRSKTDSATKAQYELHWLPIKAIIEYKILLLVFKCLHNVAPKYLENLLIIYNREGVARNL